MTDILRFGAQVLLGIVVAIAAAILTAIMVGALLFFAEKVYAHEAIPTAAAPLGWSYPWACCASLDCRSVSDSAVTETPLGYRITSTGEIIAYSDKRIKDSPDGIKHWCAHQAGLDADHTICLFMPPKGF